MKSKGDHQQSLTRRRLLPILFGGFLIPYLGLGHESEKNENEPDESGEEYRTFLKADGTTVRVKVHSLKNARVIKKKVSNRSLLNWLHKN